MPLAVRPMYYHILVLMPSTTRHCLRSNGNDTAFLPLLDARL